MQQNPSQKQMSPVNIDQNRAIGQDSFTEGSRMGREANKAHGFPGEAEQIDASESSATQASSQDGSADASAAGTREEAVRQAAYEIYQRRVAAGNTWGSETDDWLEAEAQVKKQRGDQ